MKRNKGIIAYGTEEDRKKLAVLSHLTGKSSSEWLVEQIRKVYKESFGEAAPERIVPHQN